MPDFTSPDAIEYPVAGDPMAPLNGWFARLASSIQAALTALRTEVIEEPLPAPITITGATVQNVTATSWADLPNAPAITLELDRACWVQITHGAWMTAGTSGGDVRGSSAVSGATSIAEAQVSPGGSTSVWGHVMYSVGTSTRQQTGTRVVRLNAGTNTIRLRAYGNGGTGPRGMNYSSLQVSPLRWA